MQSRIADGRRAAPPRPTLLVGDILQCHAAFDRLQQRVLELSLERQACIDETAGSSVDAWRDLVPRCRALRETLTSLRQLSHFTREVYECAADVCARAQDWPEALKALQQLVHLIYPALAVQQLQQQQQQRCSPVPAGPPGLTSSAPSLPAAAAEQGSGCAAVARWADEGCDEDGDAGLLGGLGAALVDGATVAAALRQPEFRRWPEAAAALSLYFACVQQQAGDRLDTLTTLRRFPRRILETPEVQLALRLHSALGGPGGNFVSLFRLRSSAPQLVQLVTVAAAQRGREQALVVMAAAYRSIAVPAVCRMLQLASNTRQLLACLKLLADRGHLGAQRALGGLQQEEQVWAATVVFK
ncbi:hypothetical protein CHLNCDRAFT_136526 [Chlorella variabilis]|uniref:Uncharacterized protein n=1 Tax=Chlorella variabilis TaxID=554065 RepID=E1ZKJ0_CHLVA|nr:hypothetical protein CHLNCDRAFT_136526 [Chlorella variabilis]EFN53701.1 hypothetical protein CHLNCDRAFT_136526 [Chlorella variabilis]|eukprot:XP_005845803.1 hypothetical protein CHLNCDRAFT_136526 [Chlorella variabilis]